MADELYVRLACVDCSRLFDPNTGKRGRRRIRCTVCSPEKLGQPNRYVPVPTVERTCANVACGVPFTTGIKTKRVCSRACAERVRRGPIAPKPCPACGRAVVAGRYCSEVCAQAMLEKRLAREALRGFQYTKTCVECGSQFQHPWRAVAMYCSKACKCRAHGAKHGTRLSTCAALRRDAGLAVAAAIAGLAKARAAGERALRSAERAAAEAAKHARRATRCYHCAAPMPPGIHGSKRYCSEACVKVAWRQSESCRASRAARRAARRARIRSVTVDSFDPIAIFERDGWRCQICGVKTPKKLRGTCKPNAPELDHRIPLAKGGAHSPENTQCACRACNAEKSDKVVIGQLGLFTEILNESIKARRKPRPTKPTEPAPVAGF